MAAYSATPENLHAPRPKRWTKREYRDLVATGALAGQRVYLFRGEIIEMAPQLHPHAYTLTRLTARLFGIFGIEQGYDVRIQVPFDAPGESDPEPDALVCTTADGLRKPHPNRAELVIEVADSSLAGDREMTLEYAAAGVPEYWIIDVNARRVEVYRGPLPDPTTALGFRYPPPVFVDETTPITPLAKPEATFVLSTVLPQAS